MMLERTRCNFTGLQPAVMNWGYLATLNGYYLILKKSIKREGESWGSISPIPTTSDAKTW